MRTRLAWRRLSSGVGRRLRALDHTDLGRGAIALLMAAVLAVAMLVLIEVRHFSRVAARAEDQGPTLAATVELAAATYSEISSQIQAVLLRMDDAEVADQETAAEFYRRQDELLDRTQANQRELAALRVKVEAVIAIEEARRETQLRFERWLEQVEAKPERVDR